jgi:hypothetical protein
LSGTIGGVFRNVAPARAAEVTAACPARVEVRTNISRREHVKGVIVDNDTMSTETESTAGFEQYLALGAGLHAIVDGVPADVYPISTWDDLQKAASSIDDVELIVPGGKRSFQKEILRPNLLAIRRILGKEYFPIEDQQDFARKAGLVIMTVVVRHFGSPSPQKSPDEDTAAEIEAFKRELAELEAANRKAD